MIIEEAGLSVSEDTQEVVQDLLEEVVQDLFLLDFEGVVRDQYLFIGVAQDLFVGLVQDLFLLVEVDQDLFIGVTYKAENIAEIDLLVLVVTKEVEVGVPQEAEAGLLVSTATEEVEVKVITAAAAEVDPSKDPHPSHQDHQ